MEYVALVQYTTEEGIDGEHEINLTLTTLTKEAEEAEFREKLRLIKEGVLAISPAKYTSWFMTISNDKGVVAYFESDGCEEFPH